MSLLSLGLFGAGLALLILGAELLVRGSSRLAASLGVSPLLVGLTVVGFGTSAPELAVSLGASLKGTADIALGNVVGSNIFNVLFILGASALVAPLAVAQKLVRIDVPIMVGVFLAVFAMALDGVVSRPEGGLLFAGIVLYLVFCALATRGEQDSVREEYERVYGAGGRSLTAHRLRLCVMVVTGLALLILGARWLVAGAVSIAAALGVGELVVGLTIVAAGTSLPEVATSILASYRGERDIAVGNVVGSNLFNILSVLGLTALFSPGGVAVSPAALRFDLPIMIAVGVACLPVFFTGSRISRWEGALFLAYYGAYTLYLFLSASGSEVLPEYKLVMAGFFLPLTAVTLLVVFLRSLRRS